MYDLPEMLIRQPIEFPAAIPFGAIRWSIGKLRELSSEMVFRTSRVLANLRWEIEDPFRRCSAQKQNSTATSMVKIP
jgi:hypothetical protein